MFLFFFSVLFIQSLPFATNDPWYGGVTHLNDVVFVMPVFFENEIIAWTANIAHWPDISGMAPGSLSTEAIEIFQEGLRLPAIKIIDEGIPITSVLDFLTVNSRLPEFLRGDMWAGIAAVRLGEKRLLELAKKYGAKTFKTAFEHFMFKSAAEGGREPKIGAFSPPLLKVKNKHCPETCLLYTSPSPRDRG